MNSVDSLIEFQDEIKNRDKSQTSKGRITTEMFTAVVKSVDSSKLTVDVFIPKINTEVKNVQTVMHSMTAKGGGLSLPQKDSYVIIVFVSYMKPFILGTVPMLDSDIPQIYKNESIEYTDNTMTKHTLNGDITNIAGSSAANVIKSDGTVQDYLKDRISYSRNGFDLSSRSENHGSIKYSVSKIGTDKTSVNPYDKLLETRTKLQNHLTGFSKLRDDVTKLGVNPSDILDSVSQLRTLIYNDYKGEDNYVVTQKGYALKGTINNIADIKNAKEEDLKYSIHGNKIVYETLLKLDGQEMSISIDSLNNLDIKCNKLTINGKEVMTNG